MYLGVVDKVKVSMDCQMADHTSVVFTYRPSLVFPVIFVTFPDKFSKQFL